MMLDEFLKTTGLMLGVIENIDFFPDGHVRKVELHRQRPPVEQIDQSRYGAEGQTVAAVLERVWEGHMTPQAAIDAVFDVYARLLEAHVQGPALTAEQMIDKAFADRGVREVDPPVAPPDVDG